MASSTMFAPPRPSFPFNTPLENDDGFSDAVEDHTKPSSSSLLALQGPSPSTGGSLFSSTPLAGRPLSSIDNNMIMGIGLRQRPGKSSDIMKKDFAMHPPRRSLTTAMATQQPIVTDAASIPIPTSGTKARAETKSTVLQKADNWVVVYGFQTPEQFDEVMKIFKGIGTVTEVKGAPMSGMRNWVAFNYESELLVTRAMARHPLTLSDNNIICGVQKLGNDSRAFFMQHNKPNVSSLVPRRYIPSPPKGNINIVNFNDGSDDNKSDEDDILVGTSIDDATASNKDGICNIIMSWVYAW